ncbi:MAG TPA: CPBP family intramembrane glutamic endopeptidase [Pseudolabrys sp.]|nr:CPBP family intramembrane glutamic endopeptidase [Pseudolabrys sp.]
MTTFDQSGVNARPPMIPGASGPRPIGFWLTICWLGAALAAALLFVFILLGSYEFIFGSLPSDTKVEQDLIPCTYIIVVIVLIEIVRHAGWSVRDYFALIAPTRQQMFLAVAAGVAFLLIDNIVGLLDPTPPDPMAYLYFDKALAEGLLPLLWLNIILFAPIAEEMVFRGFLYRGWSQTRLGPSATIVLTAILFGLIHIQYDWFGMASIAISGLIMGWLRWRSGSLVLPILAHATNNTIVATIVALAD